MKVGVVKRIKFPCGSKFKSCSVVFLLLIGSIMDWRIIILCLCLFHVSLTWWPFAENEEEDEQMETRTDSSSLPPPVSMVPFEAMSAEQKFLQESKKLLDLSPLDQCQHKVRFNIIILHVHVCETCLFC